MSVMPGPETPSFPTPNNKWVERENRKLAVDLAIRSTSPNASNTQLLDRAKAILEFLGE